MICPGCQTLNFRDYKFCRECGHKLELRAQAQPTMAFDAATASVNDDAQLQRLLDEAFRALESGALSDAALACQGALALRPESTAAHSLLGLVYERQGEIQDAIQQYRIVLDLNPTSKADRAKLDALLRGTGQKRLTWWDRLRRLPTRTLAGAAATVLVLVIGLLVLAHSVSPPEGRHRRLNTPTVRTALDPAPPVSYPSLQAAAPAPPPPAFATPSVAPGVGAIPRHTLTNDPVPQMTQVTQASPRVVPRDGTSSRPPTFLSPAPIRGMSGSSPGAIPGTGLRPARGRVPVLPDTQAAPSAPAATQEGPPIVASVAPTPVGATPAPDNAIPGTSINIHRLDGESSGNTNPPVSQPSLADARYHYTVAGEMYRRGDIDGAYREFANARELFQRVNSRGGSEGVVAAEGALASHRAMQQIAATRR